jgi:hypothetical protein
MGGFKKGRFVSFLFFFFFIFFIFLRERERGELTEIFWRLINE